MPVSDSELLILMEYRGPSINYVVSVGEEGGQKLPILQSKKTTKREEGGQNFSTLRQHSLWMAPKQGRDVITPSRTFLEF